jgi:[NiFe] hydrogenase diaphorase moiety large subunit
MLVSENERLREDLVAWTNELGASREALMPVLQRTQRKYFRVSDYAMQVIADLFDIHPVEVYGVVSFYSFLDCKPKGKFIVRLCQTLSCDMQGKDRVAQQLVNDLEVPFGETTIDGMFTLEWANCIGMCDQGPALLVNEQVFTRVTPEKVHQIIEGCRQAVGAHATEQKEEYLV